MGEQLIAFCSDILACDLMCVTNACLNPSILPLNSGPTCIQLLGNLREVTVAVMMPIVLKMYKAKEEAKPDRNTGLVYAVMKRVPYLNARLEPKSTHYR